MPQDTSAVPQQQKQSGLKTPVVVLSLLLATAGLAVGATALVRLNTVEDDLARVEESLDQIAQVVGANASDANGSTTAIERLEIAVDSLDEQVLDHGGDLWGIGEAIRCLDSNWAEYVTASNEDRGGTYFSNCAEQLTQLD